jgi:hypothetical protein
MSALGFSSIRTLDKTRLNHRGPRDCVQKMQSRLSVFLWPLFWKAACKHLTVVARA